MPRPAFERQPKQQRALRTRQKLLEGAIAVIQRHGVTNLTMERVAAQAGVSKGGLLYHFGTKDELLAALLDATLATAGSELEERAAPLANRPGAFAKAYLEYVRQPYIATLGNDVASAILAVGALDDELLSMATERFARWHDQLIESGLSPELALLVRIVSDGLWLIDQFALAAPTAEQRAPVIDLITSLIDAELDADHESEV